MAHRATKPAPPVGNEFATAFWESFLSSGAYDPAAGDAYKQFAGWIGGYIERELQAQHERHARECLQEVLAAERQAILERRLQRNPARWVAANKLIESELMVLACLGRSPNKFAVQVATAYGQLVSLFVDARALLERDNHFYLHVYALPGSLEPETIRVLLPTVAFEIGARWVNVAAGSVADTGYSQRSRLRSRRNGWVTTIAQSRPRQFARQTSPQPLQLRRECDSDRRSARQPQPFRRTHRGGRMAARRQIRCTRATCCRYSQRS